MKHIIKVQRTAHFYSINEAEPITKVLMVIHGYAQLAKDFIQEFNYLEGKNILVIAPEGLSKFYGKERTPVASWMTNHERLNEINDYINYLNDIGKWIDNNYNQPEKILLGFSQGVSTSMRWLAQSKTEISHNICCSGSIPPELRKEEFIAKPDLKTYFYYGDDDRLMKPQLAIKAIEQLETLNLKPIVVHFKGRHEIPKETHQLIKSLV